MFAVKPQKMLKLVVPEEVKTNVTKIHANVFLRPNYYHLFALAYFQLDTFTHLLFSKVEA